MLSPPSGNQVLLLWTKGRKESQTRGHRDWSRPGPGCAKRAVGWGLIPSSNVSALGHVSSKFTHNSSRHVSPGGRGCSFTASATFRKPTCLQCKAGQLPEPRRSCAQPVTVGRGFCRGNQLPCFGNGCPVSFQTRLPVLPRADDKAPRVCLPSLLWPMGPGAAKHLQSV